MRDSGFFCMEQEHKKARKRSSESGLMKWIKLEINRC